MSGDRMNKEDGAMRILGAMNNIDEKYIEEAAARDTAESNFGAAAGIDTVKAAKEKTGTAAVKTAGEGTGTDADRTGKKLPFRIQRWSTFASLAAAVILLVIGGKVLQLVGPKGGSTGSGAPVQYGKTVESGGGMEAAEAQTMTAAAAAEAVTPEEAAEESFEEKSTAETAALKEEAAAEDAADVEAAAEGTADLEAAAEDAGNMDTARETEADLDAAPKTEADVDTSTSGADADMDAAPAETETDEEAAPEAEADFESMQNMAAIANPFMEAGSMEEASKTAGFGFALPDGQLLERIFSGNADHERIDVITGEMIQITYFNEADDRTAVLRKKRTDRGDANLPETEGIADISGDYNNYNEQEKIIDEENGRVMLVRRSSEPERTNVIWEKDGFAYALLCESSALENEEITALLADVD